MSLLHFTLVAANFSRADACDIKDLHHVKFGIGFLCFRSYGHKNAIINYAGPEASKVNRRGPFLNLLKIIPGWELSSWELVPDLGAKSLFK